MKEAIKKVLASLYENDTQNFKVQCQNYNP